MSEPFDELAHYTYMDAKDQLINELQKKLQCSEAQSQRKDAELDQARRQLTQTQSQLELTNSQHSATTEQFTQTLAEKDRELAELKHQIKLLIQRIRGSRQERINPDQLLLFSVEELQQLAKELEEQSAAGDDEATEPVPPVPPANPPGGNKRSGRKPLPKNLPREIVRHELNDEARKCPCCGEVRDEMGVESSEQLEFVPAHWKVIQHDRVKYACKSCQENVAIAAMRARDYDGAVGRFTTSDPFPAQFDQPGTLHRYSFALNNPANFTDPSGYFTLAEQLTSTGLASELI